MDGRDLADGIAAAMWFLGCGALVLGAIIGALVVYFVR